MEFCEIYRGVTINFRYDPVTFTFLGNFSDLGHPVSIQAASYEDLQDACMKAVDDALVVDRISIADYAAKWHRSDVSGDVSGSFVENRVPVRTEDPTGLPEDDPFARRRFLG